MKVFVVKSENVKKKILVLFFTSIATKSFKNVNFEKNFLRKKTGLLNFNLFRE